MAPRKAARKGGKLSSQRVSVTSSQVVGHIERRPSVSQHLPFEVLAEIFTFAIPTTYNPYKKDSSLLQWTSFHTDIFPLNIAVVCRTWRAAVLSTDALWTTFFVELHNASSKSFTSLKRYLRLLLNRFVGDEAREKRYWALRIGIRFVGMFDFAKACDSLKPLLQHQRRWEKIDLSFDHQASFGDPIALKMADLTSLEELQLQGTNWTVKFPLRTDCIQDGGFKVTEKVTLSRLQTLKLHDVDQYCRFGLLSAAQNVDVLEISVNKSEPYRLRSCFLPKLRKLTINDKSARTNVLGSLECPELKELYLAGASRSTFTELLEFVSQINVKLETLDFAMWDNFEPGVRDMLFILDVLLTQELLKELSIRCRRYKDSCFLPGLGTWDKGEEPFYCPLLTKVYLSGFINKANLFTDFVNRRCRMQDGTVFKMTFHNCKITNESGPPHHRLHSIEGVERGKEEGLELFVTNETHL